MRLDIISVHPKIFDGAFSNSIVKRAVDKKLVDIHLHDLRDYSKNKYNQVDDYQYGGGAGMVLMIEPIEKCITQLKSERDYDDIIYMAPDGDLLDQSICNNYSLKKNLIILCGHYKGIDQRVRDHFVTKEISIGDYVLTGGEQAAIVFCDAIIRLIPNVLGNAESALSDSFQDGLVSHPVYTRPSDYKGMKVPDTLLSGDPKKIEEWRQTKAEEITEKRKSKPS